MNGLFWPSLLDPGVRAEQGTCSASCSTYACFKGGPADGEGPGHGGCPLGTHPLTSRTTQLRVCLTCAPGLPAIASVQLSLRASRRRSAARDGAPAGEAGLADPWCCAGGGRLPEVLGSGCWGAGRWLQLGLQARTVVAAAGLWLPGPWPCRRCWFLALRCGLSSLPGFFALRQRCGLGLLWLVAPALGPCCWAAIFRSAWRRAGMVLP